MSLVGIVKETQTTYWSYSNMKCCNQDIIITTKANHPIYIDKDIGSMNPDYVASCVVCGSATIGETEAIAKENYKANIKFKERRKWDL